MSTQENNVLLLEKDPSSAYVGMPRTLTGTDELVFDVSSVSIDGALDLSGNLSMAGTLAVTGPASVSGNLSVGGNLDVAGDIISRDQVNVVLQDSFLDLGFGNSTDTAASGGFTVQMNRAASFIAGNVTDFSGNTFTYADASGSTLFAGGEVIAITGLPTELAANEGFYVVLSVSGASFPQTVTIKTSAMPNLPWAQTAFDASGASVSGQAFQSDISVLAIADGSNFPQPAAGYWPKGTLVLAYQADATEAAFDASGAYIAVGAGSTTLQNAYENGNTITTDAGDGDVVITGDQKLAVSATGGVQITGGALVVDTSADYNLAGAFTVDGAQAVSFGATTEVASFSVDASGDVSLDAGAALELYAGATVDMSGVALDARFSGAASIDAASASNFSVSAGDLSLQALGAGSDLYLEAADVVDLSGASLNAHLADRAVIDASNVTLDLSGSDASLDASGAINLDAGSNIFASAAVEILLDASNAQIDLSGNNAAVDASGVISLSAAGAVAAAIDINASAGGIDVDASGAITIDSTGGAIGIGTASATGAINIGTAGVRTITLGQGVNTGPTLVLDGGVGSAVLEGYGSLVIGSTYTSAETITVGSVSGGALGYERYVFLGSSTTASSTTLYAGTAGMTLASNGAVVIQTTGFGVPTIDLLSAGASGTITINNSSSAPIIIGSVGTGSINIGTAGNRSITFGHSANTTATSIIGGNVLNVGAQSATGVTYLNSTVATIYGSSGLQNPSAAGIRVVAGEIIYAGDVLVIRKTSAQATGIPEVVLADANGTDIRGFAGVAIASIASGATGNMASIPGTIAMVSLVAAPSAGQSGLPVYVATTAGYGTLTAPAGPDARVFVIGYLAGTTAVGGLYPVQLMPQFIADIPA
jgi:hypothetical protein